MRLHPESGARLVLAALLFGNLAAPPLAAQVLSPAFDPYAWEEPYQQPPPLPEGLRGTVRPRPDAPKVERIDRIAQIFQAIQACWRPASGSGYSGQEITLRLSFKRNGEVLGQPRITYYKAGTQDDRREPFTRAVREAFERCTPLPFTESFGRAIAGRVFSFRFVDARPM
ncbi:hypothetical protein HPT29_010145 [Microvirga terrae]|uniref:TonB C-terminal domain-containing protein n=1 Tax=Microvirga terrae TaxID=2740529 RepID=A0ABY5RW21_9HYPH|nr:MULTISPECIES: hypothetical protein [Microvirga]MBQ0819295.1 hypothetical protein [Microvirga sp. HBU67558]UVF21446.1 hypothetical protein HPT29_010145 [Microvirga terrae]